MQLTEKQQQILDFIEQTQRSKGLSPTTREIQNHFGFASRNAVTDHLGALRKKGAIRSHEGKARSITLPEFQQRSQSAMDHMDRMAEIPLYGMIPAGLPADQQQENDGFISIDLESLKISRGARTFALKVRGDSMINAGIFQGDTVILEYKEARDKDIVAALVDGETTLKRYMLRKGTPYLKAENPRYANITPASELLIQGVVIAVLRVLK